MVMVLKDLYDDRDDGKIISACFIDYCKAFDSVHHPTLIAKICNLNIQCTWEAEKVVNGTPGPQIPLRKDTHTGLIRQMSDLESAKDLF